MKNDNRPCERKCLEKSEGGCGESKHHSRFRTWRSSHGRDGTVSASVSFAPLCKACEQKHRNEKKNANRPLAVIESRASAAANRLRVSREFIMVQMNYRSLVLSVAALLNPEALRPGDEPAPDALCPCCGHTFRGERDIQIEHIAAPRHDKDWAREHARNLRFICGSCNGTKGAKGYEECLDEQEDARLSNLEQPSKPRQEADETQTQLDLL